MIKNRSNKQKKLIDKRIEKVTSTINKYKTNPDAEIELLDSLSRYPEYSIRNIILAESQNKGSFSLASSKDFQAMGYYVQKGQEAITITLPHREGIFRDAAGTKKLVQHANQQEKQAIIDDRIQTHLVTTHFQSIPVYDITQTNCPPEIFWKLYPEVRANFSFDQTEENYEWFEKALYQYIKEKEFIVRFDSVQNSKKLKYVIGKNEVIIDNQLSLKERTELLVRELARAELENYRQVTLEKDSVEVMEFKENQKEMAAYVVSKSLGMEKEDYTQSYLMNWQPKAIKDEIYIRMLEEVKETSLSLVDVLVKKFNTLKDSK